MANAKRDENFIPGLLAASDVDSATPVPLEADPSTKRLKTNTTVTGIVEVVTGLSIGEFDYVSMALSGGDTTETYTFKTGGSGGTTVATVEVVYTDSTREVLSTVTKT